MSRCRVVHRFRLVRWHGRGHGACFRNSRSFHRNLHPLPHFGQSLAHGGFPGEDQFAGPFEIVVGETGDVGLDYQVCGTSPEMAHLVLGNGERLSYHVKKVPRRAVFRPLPFKCTASTRCAPISRSGRVGTG